MKKILSLALMAISVSMFLSQPAKAASSFDGFVEEVGSTGYVKGWFYGHDQPVDISLTFKAVGTFNGLNNTDTRTYIINARQASNKISYFTQRDDVKAYLRTKYSNPTFNYPQGFLLTTKFLPVGQWRLDSVSGASITDGTIPIVASNRNITITNSEPYVEGYIDKTSTGTIQGWAYNSSKANASMSGGAYYGPQIDLELRKQSSGETQSFMFQTSQNEGLINRTYRQDVISFLTNYRGQFTPGMLYPTGSDPTNLLSGFTIGLQSSSQIGITPGNWEIISIKMDGQEIPFGNTNPSHVIYIQ